jgi:hypothetical protein
MEQQAAQQMLVAIEKAAQENVLTIPFSEMCFGFDYDRY